MSIRGGIASSISTAFTGRAPIRLLLAALAKRWWWIAGVEQKAHFLAVNFPHSDACFVKAYPAETTEAFCDGHNAALFGALNQDQECLLLGKKGGAMFVVVDHL